MYFFKIVSSPNSDTKRFLYQRGYTKLFLQSCNTHLSWFEIFWSVMTPWARSNNYNHDVFLFFSTISLIERKENGRYNSTASPKTLKMCTENINLQYKTNFSSFWSEYFWILWQAHSFKRALYILPRIWVETTCTLFCFELVVLSYRPFSFLAKYKSSSSTLITATFSKSLVM